MIAAAVTDRLSISRRGTQKFNMKRRDLKNGGVMELYEFKVPNRLKLWRAQIIEVTSIWLHKILE